MPGDNLIFLISQPRAGSTLLQRILSNYPQIQTSAEPWVMLHPFYALRSQGYEVEYNASWARSALKDFLQMLPEGEETYYEGIRRMYGYLYDRLLENSHKRYFLDKTPRYYHIIPELFQTFPEAHFIILLRNPLAVLCSIFNTWVKKDWSKFPYYQYDLLDAPHLMQTGREILGEKSLVLSYEDLLTNPEKEIKKICDRLQIEFIPEALSYNLDSSLQKGFGYKDQKTSVYQSGKPNSQNADKWIEELKDPQLWRLANDYLTILGREAIAQMEYCYDTLQQQVNSQRPSRYQQWKTLPFSWFLNPSNSKIQKWKSRLVKTNKITRN
jgi:hypothetical protein